MVNAGILKKIVVEPWDKMLGSIINDFAVFISMRKCYRIYQQERNVNKVLKKNSTEYCLSQKHSGKNSRTCWMKDSKVDAC